MTRIRIVLLALLASNSVSSQLLAQVVPPMKVQGAAPKGLAELATVLVAVRAARIAYIADSTRLFACQSVTTWQGDTLVLGRDQQNDLYAKSGGNVLEECPTERVLERDVMVTGVQLTPTSAYVAITRRVRSEVVLEGYSFQWSGVDWRLKQIHIVPIGKV